MATPVRLHPASGFAPSPEACVHEARPLPFRLQIGSFELDPKSGELSTADKKKIVLQWQPMQLLLMLIDRDGEMVTRAEIEHQLWGEGVIVDFDRSINQLVRRLRRTLGDSAKDPSYIETVARRGYRLKVPVRALDKGTGSFQEANNTPSAAGKLPDAWNSHEAREPAASGKSSTMRLQSIAGAIEPRDHGRSRLHRRARTLRQTEDPRERSIPLMQALARQPLRQYLLSSDVPERLEALRQLLVLITQVLEGEPI